MLQPVMDSGHGRSIDTDESNLSFLLFFLGIFDMYGQPCQSYVRLRSPIHEVQ